MLKLIYFHVKDIVDDKSLNRTKLNPFLLFISSMQEGVQNSLRIR